MVDIILKKRITVKTIIVRADISFLKPINYFLPILQHMKENSWRTNSKIFCEKLLGLGNNAIAESLLSRCEYLELVEKSHNSHSDITDYKITENGKSALDEKSVFIPEEGVWEIHYTEDQFIPSKSQILTIIQPSPKTLQETNRSKKENKKHCYVIIDVFGIKKLIKKRLTMIKDNDFLSFFQNKEFKICSPVTFGIDIFASNFLFSMLNEHVAKLFLTFQDMLPLVDFPIFSTCGLNSFMMTSLSFIIVRRFFINFLKYIGIAVCFLFSLFDLLVSCNVFGDGWIMVNI